MSQGHSSRNLLMQLPFGARSMAGADESVPVRVWRGRVVVAAGLVVLSVVGRVVVRANPDDLVARVFGAVVNVDREFSVPTVFNAWLLGVGSLLCVGLWVRRSERFWLGAGVFMAVATVDELFSFHERTIGPLQDLLGIQSGPLYFSWVVIGIPVVVVAGLVAMRFVGALPADVRVAVVGGGVLVVLGAIGMEMVGGAYAASVTETVAATDPWMWMIVSVEEFLEMVGAASINLGLARYLSRSTRPISSSQHTPRRVRVS